MLTTLHYLKFVKLAPPGIPIEAQGIWTARHKVSAFTARRRLEIWTAPPRTDTQTR